MDSTNINHGLGGQGFVASKDGEVNNRLAIASLILRSQPQGGSSYAVNLLKDIDMLTQFFPVARHLRFEDVQAVVDLISDARQISGLLISSSLNDFPIYPLFQLNNVCILPCNPLAPSRTAIQSVDADTILRCNEASSLATNEVSFNSFPVYVQSLRHKPSLSSIVHKVKASMIPRFEDALTTNQRSNQP